MPRFRHPRRTSRRSPRDGRGGSRPPLPASVPSTARAWASRALEGGDASIDAHLADARPLGRFGLPRSRARGRGRGRPWARPPPALGGRRGVAPGRRRGARRLGSRGRRSRPGGGALGPGFVHGPARGDRVLAGSRARPRDPARPRPDVPGRLGGARRAPRRALPPGRGTRGGPCRAADRREAVGRARASSPAHRPGRGGRRGDPRRGPRTGGPAPRVRRRASRRRGRPGTRRRRRLYGRPSAAEEKLAAAREGHA